MQFSTEFNSIANSGKESGSKDFEEFSNLNIFGSKSKWESKRNLNHFGVNRIQE